MNILIYNSGGGLGDCIQLMNLLTSLKSKFSNSTIWYLGAHVNHFDGQLNDYNIKLNNLNLENRHFGFRWKQIFSAKNKCKKLVNDKFDIITLNVMILFFAGSMVSQTFLHFSCRKNSFFMGCFLSKFLFLNGINQKLLIFIFEVVKFWEI